jgi:hypothetical protein
VIKEKPMSDQFFQIETRFTKIDHRRERRYGKECHVTVRCHGIGDPEKDNGTLGLFREVLAKHLPKAKAELPYSSSRSMSFSVKIGVVSMVDKPSLTPTDEHMRSLIPLTDEQIVDAVKAAHAEAHAILEAQKAEESNLNRAAQLLDWYDSDVNKAAKEIVRSQQRLDALIAEFKAEVEVQAAKLLDKSMADIAEQDTEGRFNETSRQMFKDHAVNYVIKNKRSGLPSRFPMRGYENEGAKTFLRETMSKKSG